MSLPTSAPAAPNAWLFTLCEVSIAIVLTGGGRLQRARRSDLEQQLDEDGLKTWFLGKGPGFGWRTYHRLHRVFKEFARTSCIPTCT